MRLEPYGRLTPEPRKDALLTSRLHTFGTSRAVTPAVLPGQRIGLMGGSFNPPHEGHLAIAEAALKRLDLDRVWWIVTPGNPLKPHHELRPLPDRMAAARRIAVNPRIKVTSLEAALGTVFTAETLGFLLKRHPGVRFVWIMGADNLASFHRWRAWRRIFETVPVAVMDRPGWRLRALSAVAAKAFSKGFVPEARAASLARRRPPAWTFLTLRLSPASSTALRAGKRR